MYDRHNYTVYFVYSFVFVSSFLRLFFKAPNKHNSGVNHPLLRVAHPEFTFTKRVGCNSKAGFNSKQCLGLFRSADAGLRYTIYNCCAPFWKLSDWLCHTCYKFSLRNITLVFGHVSSLVLGVCFLFRSFRNFVATEKAVIGSSLKTVSMRDHPWTSRWSVTSLSNEWCQRWCNCPNSDSLVRHICTAWCIALLCVAGTA